MESWIHDSIGRWYAERDSFASAPVGADRGSAPSSRRLRRIVRTAFDYSSPIPQEKNKRHNGKTIVSFTGTPKGTRTPDLLIRRQIKLIFRGI